MSSRVEGLDTSVVRVTDVHQHAVPVLAPDLSDQSRDPGESPALDDLHARWPIGGRLDPLEIQMGNEMRVEVVQVDQCDRARGGLRPSGTGCGERRHQAGPDQDPSEELARQRI